MIALTTFILNNNTTVSIVPEFPTANLGHVVVSATDTGVEKSKTVITDSKPLEQLDVEHLDRIIYVQSHNSELDLSDSQREELRRDLARMYSNKPWMSEAHWEHFETNNGVMGGLMLDHIDGKLAQVTVVVRCNKLEVDVMSALHLENGPVNFTETYLSDANFVNAMAKITHHFMANA